MNTKQMVTLAAGLAAGVAIWKVLSSEKGSELINKLCDNLMQNLTGEKNKQSETTRSSESKTENTRGSTITN